MADKYAHLRPRLDRRCHRADRVPKMRYTQPRAEAAAARHPGYVAYECPCCGWWHIGRDWHRQAPTGTPRVSGAAGALQAATRAELVAAWVAWDRFPARRAKRVAAGRPARPAAVTDRFAAAVKAAAVELGCSTDDLHRALGACRRAGRDHATAVDLVAADRHRHHRPPRRAGVGARHVGASGRTRPSADIGAPGEGR